MIFPLLYTSFKNRMCNGMSSFVRKICFIQAYRGRENNCCQWRKVGGTVRLSFHISQYIKEMIKENRNSKKHTSNIFVQHIMLHESQLFKKLFRCNKWILLQLSIKTNSSWADTWEQNIIQIFSNFRVSTL